MHGQNGLFSGWADGKYDTGHLEVREHVRCHGRDQAAHSQLGGLDKQGSADENTAWGELDNNCVLKLLWRNYKRYDKATVSRITGIPADKLEAVYAEYAKTGATGKAGTIMYAMGATQHTYGVQNIRTYSIVQLLLGNMGVAGGGINALRGTSNVQGSTDQALLEQYLPGYLKTTTDIGRPPDAGRLRRQHHSCTDQSSRRLGRRQPRELVEEHAKVRSQPAQGLVARRRLWPTATTTCPRRRPAGSTTPTWG